MSRVPVNQTFKQQQARLVPATFKRAVISRVNSQSNTVDVYFIENPQTVIRNISVAASVDLAAVTPGMIARVDTFGENSPNSMVVAYVVGQSIPAYTVLQAIPTAPANFAAGGTPGMVYWDTNFLYICVAANTWRRVALSSF